MKRSLIAVALAVLGLTGTVAIAEPTIDMSDNAFRAVPETTSYQATEVNAQEGVFVWNP
jgi:hypothetical protein